MTHPLVEKPRWFCWKSVVSCHCNMTVGFARGKQSREKTRTTFDDDFIFCSAVMPWQTWCCVSGRMSGSFLSSYGWCCPRTGLSAGLCVFTCVWATGDRYWLVQPTTSLEIVDLALGTKMFGLRCIRQSTNVLLCELSSGAEKLWSSIPCVVTQFHIWVWISKFNCCHLWTHLVREHFRWRFQANYVDIPVSV